MTHFRTYCISEYDTDELCEKFSEHTEVPEYSNGEVQIADVVSFVEYYTTEKYGDNIKCTNDKLVKNGSTLTKRYRNEVNAPQKRYEIFKEIMKEVFEPLYELFGEECKELVGVWVRDTIELTPSHPTEDYTEIFPHFVYD